MREDSNQKALNRIAWILAGEAQEFDLILARCNSIGLSKRLIQRLESRCDFPIQKVVLDPATVVLYTTLEAQLSQENCRALVVIGFESVQNLDSLLTGANIKREDFRKNFRFPNIWWVNDEILTKFHRLAPDLESFAKIVEFEISTNELTYAIEEATDRVFEQIVDRGATRFLDNAAFNFNVGSRPRTELEATYQELQQREAELDPYLEGSLEFVLSPKVSWSQAQTLLHYERNLDRWQQIHRNLEPPSPTPPRPPILAEAEPQDSLESLLDDISHHHLKHHHPSPTRDRIFAEIQASKIVEREGCLAYCLGVWWRNYAQDNRVYYRPACELAKDYFQQCLQVFETGNRPDLVAKFINALGDILERLQDWEELEKVGEEAIALHQEYPNPFRLARAYSFCGEAALGQFRWQAALDFAQEAIAISNSAPPDDAIPLTQSGLSVEWVRSYNQGSYHFLLARAQRALNLAEQSFTNLELAKGKTKSHYEPDLYIRILQELQTSSFERGDYLQAFRFKQKRRSIEQQFGLRAFIGAGKLLPNQQVARQASPTGQPMGTIAREINASGRQKDVQNLVERIGRVDCKLTVIYGQSGVGKSSILQAGLIPALHQKAIGTRDVLPILQSVYTHWQNGLGQSLANGLASTELSSEIDRELSFSTGEEILTQLNRNAKQNLLTVLIFDQFEEFFFVYKNLKQRQEFYEFLAGCLDTHYLKIVLCLREDYLYHLLEFNRFTDLGIINNNILDKNILYHLGNLQPAEAKSLVKTLSQQAQFFLESSLIDSLVKDLAEELGEVRPIELQVVGAQLQAENIVTLSKYRDRGTHPKEKLAQLYLQGVVTDCGAENQKIAELILYLLTDENTTRPLKTRNELEQELSALAPDLVIESDRLDLILSILVESGLVFLFPDVKMLRYQLVHDYLVKIVRQQQGEDLRVKLQEAQQQRALSEAKHNRLLRRAAVGSVIVASVLALLSLVLLKSLNRADYAAQRAENQKELAERQKAKTEISEVKALSSSSSAMFASQNPFDALIESIKGSKAFQKIEAKESHQKLRNEVLTGLQQAVFWVKEYNRLEGHEGIVREVRFSPDGSAIASASDDGKLILWNPDGSQIIAIEGQAVGHHAQVRAVSFSPDGEIIATAGYDRTIRLWRRDGSEIATLKGHTAPVEAVHFHPDGQTLASASEDKTIKLWRRDGTLIRTLRSHGDAVREVRFSSDGERLASASDDFTVSLWTAEGILLKTLRQHEGEVYGLSFSPDGQILATASWDRSLKLWTRGGSLIRSINYKNRFYDVAFSPDGRTLAAASADKTVSLWSVDGLPLGKLVGHSSQVRSVSFSPDGRTIASSSGDRSVKLWRWQRDLVKVLNGHRGRIEDVAISADGSLIASAGTDRTVKVWTARGQLLNTLRNHESVVWSVDLSRDGKLLASTGADRTITLWKRKEKGGFASTPLKSFSAHSRSIDTVAFSPDGQFLATGSKDRTVKLWKLEGGGKFARLLRTIDAHDEGVLKVRFSPDGQILASTSWDNTIKLWNLEGEAIATLNDHRGWVFDVAFSPDSQLLASASYDNTVKLWRRDGTLADTFKGHSDGVSGVSFSSDGQLLASGSYDRTVKLWRIGDAEGESQLMTTLRGHRNTVTQIAFSEDGLQLVTASHDRTLLLWNLAEMGDWDRILQRGCAWVKDYLRTNPNVEPSDRALCQEIIAAD